MRKWAVTAPSAPERGLRGVLTWARWRSETATAILPLGGAKQRAALAILLLQSRPGRLRDRLVERIWETPASERRPHTRDLHISRLRKALHQDGHPERLRTRAPGYVLVVDEGELDLQQLETHIDQGRRALAADDPKSASEELTRGLGLFRGRRSRIWPTPPSRRSRWDGWTTCGPQHSSSESTPTSHWAATRSLIGELESLVAKYPLREHAWSQLMLARYRSGRQGEALATFDRARHRLADELGIDPGQSLQQLHQQILRRIPPCNMKPRRSRLHWRRSRAPPFRDVVAGRDAVARACSSPRPASSQSPPSQVGCSPHAERAAPHGGIADNPELGRGDRFAHRAVRRRCSHPRQRRCTVIRIRRHVGGDRRRSEEDRRQHRNVTDIPVGPTTSPRRERRMGVGRRRTQDRTHRPHLRRTDNPSAESDFPPIGVDTERPAAWYRRRLALGRPGCPVRPQDRSGFRQGQRHLQGARRRASRR